MVCSQVTSSCQVLLECGLLRDADCGVWNSRVRSGDTQLVLQVEDA